MRHRRAIQRRRGTIVRSGQGDRSLWNRLVGEGQQDVKKGEKIVEKSNRSLAEGERDLARARKELAQAEQQISDASATRAAALKRIEDGKVQMGRAGKNKLRDNKVRAVGGRSGILNGLGSSREVRNSLDQSVKRRRKRAKMTSAMGSFADWRLFSRWRG